MKRYTILGFMAFASFIACKKESSKNNLSEETILGISSKAPADLMALMVDAKADFQIRVSSSIGSSVYENGGATQGATIVEAYSADERNVGTFTTNAHNIPFTKKSYFYQIDSTETSHLFTGKTNTYHLEGSSFPSFTMEDYSTQLTTISFQGLQDYKLPTGSSLTVNWTPDSKFSTNGKAAIIVSCEDEQTGKYTTFYKEVAQSTGSITLNSGDLSSFNNVPYIKVYFVRGASTDVQVNGKTVSAENLVYTYARIYR